MLSVLILGRTPGWRHPALHTTCFKAPLGRCLATHAGRGPQYRTIGRIGIGRKVSELVKNCLIGKISVIGKVFQNTLVSQSDRSD
jgi:hypothetical protein